MSAAAAKPLAILDACVLYPPSLRDLLMWLASVRIYGPRWTEDIHAEWIRSVLADNPHVMPVQLERTRRLMDLIVPDCLVSNYEAHIPQLKLPDANDRHVLAAAIEARAPLIVTFNLSDFPVAVLQKYSVKAVHPDAFCSGLFDEQAHLFLRGLKEHRASLNHPAKTAAEYVQTLRATGLKELALRAEGYSHVI